jgi:hypothetical protein
MGEPHQAADADRMVPMERPFGAAPFATGS